MLKFFTPNISGRGRIFRGLCGLALVVSALLALRWSRWLCGALLVVGGFVLFEALRGWCVMRACGIKTKL